MKHFIWSFVVVFSFIISSASNAASQDIEALQKFVDQQMAYIDLTAKSLDADISSDGDPRIEEKEDYYSIIFPSMKIGSDEFHLKLGEMRVNAKRGKESYAWAMAMTYPSKIPLFYKDDNEDSPWKELATVNISKQETKFVWLQDVGLTDFLKMTLNDVVVTSPEGLKADIGILGIATKIESPRSPKANMKTAFDLENIKLVSNADDKISLEIGAINSKSTQLGVNLLKMKKDMDKLQKLLVEQVQKNEGENPDFSKLPSLMTSLFGSQGHSQDSITILKDLKIGVTNEEKNQDMVINIKEISSDFDHTKKEVLSEMNSGFGIRGISVSANSPENQKTVNEFASYIPRNFVFDFGLDKIPYEAINVFTKDILDKAIVEQSGLEGKKAEDAKKQLDGLEGDAKDLIAKFQEAESRLTINPLKITAEKYALEVAAQAEVKLESAFGFIANSTIKIEGLDELIKETSSQVTEKDTLTPEQKQQAQAGLFFLPVIKGMGTPKAGKGGKIYYEYLFDVTADGKVTLNGQDFSAFMPQPQRPQTY